ncbi:MAG: hypothetical protein ACTHXA_09530 [Gulosibacter sp.]|uniref:hypothetical protein n=1 Tax=Gulosibacter sp. TaxID=2817531 RepID=UPI003F8FFCE6
MAKDEMDNPFGATDDASLSVPTGVFDSNGPVKSRTGATNARVASGGAFASWKAASRQKKVNVIAAIAAALVVLLVLPTVISVIGIGRRDALLAQAAEDQQINIVVVSEEVLEAEDSASVVLGAYAMSSAFTPEDERVELRSRLDEVSEAVAENDASATQNAADRSREYFVDTYAPALIGNVDSLKEEWGSANYTTVTEVDEAVETISSNLELDRIDELGAAVIELSNALGLLREEHYSNRSTYVPPPRDSKPDNSDDDVVEDAPEEEPEAPAETEAPPEEGDPEGPGASEGDENADASGAESDAGVEANGDADSGGGGEDGAEGPGNRDGGADTSGEPPAPEPEPTSGFGGR